MNLTWLCVLQSPPRLEESLDGGVNTIVDFFMCRFHLPLNACHKLMTVNDTASHEKYCQTDRHEGCDPTQPFDVNQVHLLGVCTIGIRKT